MFKAIASRSTYANVMSTLAFFAAVGGGAYAAAQTTSKSIQNNTIKSIDQKDGKAVQGVDVVPDSLAGGQILESSLAQVPSAALATSAAHATSADSADTAADATNAQLSDYADLAGDAVNGFEGAAHVNTTGTSVAVAGQGIHGDEVTRQSEGVYCFNDLDFVPITALVTGSVSNDNNAQDNFFSLSTFAYGDNPVCPGVEDAAVESRDDTDTGPAALQDADFFIVFF